MANRKLELLDPRIVQSVAAIIGPDSAAARALIEYHRRTKDGERVAIFKDANRAGMLWVGPIPEELDAD